MGGVGIICIWAVTGRHLGVAPPREFWGPGLRPRKTLKSGGRIMKKGDRGGGWIRPARLPPPSLGALTLLL